MLQSTPRKQQMGTEYPSVCSKKGTYEGSLSSTAGNKWYPWGLSRWCTAESTLSWNVSVLPGPYGKAFGGLLLAKEIPCTMKTAILVFNLLLPNIWKRIEGKKWILKWDSLYGIGKTPENTCIHGTWLKLSKVQYAGHIIWIKRQKVRNCTYTNCNNTTFCWGLEDFKP